MTDIQYLKINILELFDNSIGKLIDNENFKF